MAKAKKKPRQQSDDVNRRRQASGKKSLNPFEVHINKEKMSVLGQKSKNDRGLPGVSRGKALKKRKETLLNEYKQLFKSNKFTDRRIGERNRALEDDDKIIARFSAIRSKKHNKKQLFNLADDEVLTHKGQTLAEIEKFEPTNSDDEDFDEETTGGNLDSGFVGDAHFGGGVLSKTGKEGVKTHKELIDQLIAESKKRKAEKQKIKEATLDLTEKLDDEWKDLLPLVSKKPKDTSDSSNKEPVDDYDKVMRELKFEARGTVSDRLKSEEEIAKEEKERLERLEQERLDRMKDTSTSTTIPHRSADDLDDEVVYQSDPEYMLTYNEQGESNVKIEAIIQRTAEDSDKEDEESANEDEDQSEEEGDGNESEEESDQEEEPDNLSDLKESENEDESESEPEVNEEPNTAPVKEEPSTKNYIIEKAREELPYTWSLPKNYDDFDKTFSNKSAEQKFVIIERMIKCNHASLSEGNKDKLGVLFAYLLQHFQDSSSDEQVFNTFSKLVPKLFELANINPNSVSNSIKEVLKEKHQEFKERKKLPGIEMLVFFKLIGTLFPTSDFRHPIVTPSLVFMEQILSKTRFKSRKGISYGFFLTILVLEHTIQSKRYLPASVNFLAGILHMAIPKSGVKVLKVKPPFRSNCNALVITEEITTTPTSLKMKSDDLYTSKINYDFKIRSVYTAIKLSMEFLGLLEHLPSNVEIFQDIKNFIELLPIERYPDIVRVEIKSLKEKLHSLETNRKLEYIAMPQKKPKALRLYEPKIEEVVEGHKRRKNQSREKTERDKLLHKLKKETKGALREIRRDRAFLGRVKLHEKIQSDNLRKDKVKRIFSEASIQQSELNSMERKRKKK